jgi:two-component system cell cycle sensor histidine kinase/response regulator CckA
VRTREHLELARELARLGTWEVDLSNGAWMWSASLRRMLGVGDAPACYEAFLSLIHPDDRERVDRDFARAQPGGPDELEFRVIRPDGSTRWLRSRGRVTRDRAGAAIRKVGASMDVTERYAAQDENGLLEQKLRQAQKLESLGRLAGGVAHDFNNILLAIRGYGELALRSLERGDGATEEVREMVAGAERAAGLTRQLLAFSRQQVLRAETIDLRDTVHNMERLLRGLIGADIRLVATAPDQAVLVSGDRSQLEQVIANLALNARDAMPNGGELTLRVAAVDVDADQGLAVAAGRYALLTVSDTGLGMDTETVERIFDPFFTTKDEGTGLGLATVHGIVAQSGGSIWVYSQPGHGTTFKVYLPLASSTGEPAAQPIAAPAPESLGETILLVDDDSQVRAVVCEMLETLGYRVLSAGDGEEALELADACHEPIDLLLSDLIMPGLGGRALAERLRESRPEVSILYMSGYSSEAVGRRGILGRDASFLEKPFSSADLARHVRTAVGTGPRPLPA